MNKEFSKKTIFFSCLVVFTVLILGIGCSSNGTPTSPAPCRSSCSANDDGSWTVCGNRSCPFTIYQNKRVDTRLVVCTCTVPSDQTQSSSGGGSSGGGSSGLVTTVPREPTVQERLEELRAQSERDRQETIDRFEAYERTLPAGTSSVTSPAGNQKNGNPQVNNLATNNGVVIPPSPRQGNTGSRGQGTGAQRTGGSVTSRPQQTTRDSQSANPNAAANTESRRDGAPGAQSYREQQSAGQRPQQPTTVQPTTGTSTVARVAAVPQQTPQMPVGTIAEYTPRPTPSPRQPTIIQESVNSDIAQIQINYVVQGVDWNNPEANVSRYFKVKEVFTNEGILDMKRRDVLFTLNNRDEIISRIIRLAQALDNVREEYGVPIRVNSWYRDPATNAGIAGASPTSPHMAGYAVDISDDDRMLTNFLLERQTTLLADNNLWMEDNNETPKWVHLDLVNRSTRGRPQGRERIFRP